MSFPAGRRARDVAEPSAPGVPAAGGGPATPPAAGDAVAAVLARGRRVSGRVVRSINPFAHSAPHGPLEALLAAHRAAHPKADLRLLHLAYQAAAAQHDGQLRKSGEPFITHPLAVATILADIGMDTTTLAAALLHDTVEDTGYTLEQVRASFGDEVAHLVDGVTKLTRIQVGDAAEAETIRKMILAMARDLRVLVIKLADRLHNMRTLRYQPPHKQERTARATLEVLVPLADRLGIQLFKRELEDLALATLHPDEYQEIERLLVDRAPQREAYLAGIVERLAADLRAAKIKASVAPRLRHAYSIHQKMLERRGGLTGVYDVARILVVVAGEAPDCYMALGTVHGQYHPVSGRFQDFIALPKFNLYQSLHTTVVGPGGKPIEVQLRTEAMHRIAEYGIAAYYREVGRRSADVPAAASSPDELVWLRRLLDWQRSVSDPGEFFASLREDLTDHEILLFTPKGDAVPLARGGTPVDFAYTVRSDLGHRCIGARVNGRLVPLASTLTDGDTVEVLTAPTEHPGPSEQWLGFVKTPKAQIQIRQWLAAQRSDTAAEDAVEAGRREIGRLLREQGDLGLDDETLALLDREDLEVLYTAVGQGQLPAASVAQWLLTVAGRTEVQPG